eukprot:TRINITY_DN1641_c0_g1_i1.p1 TRINITY_DN1641_c0_g1~~TRINITY_DN1641_c0_g1_i1.p1  ORF type:complete len:190 (-),score=47.78 TRINITY_DN1641_c0_g1_i1:794-1363(-)
MEPSFRPPMNLNPPGFQAMTSFAPPTSLPPRLTPSQPSRRRVVSARTRSGAAVASGFASVPPLPGRAFQFQPPPGIEGFQFPAASPVGATAMQAPSREYYDGDDDDDDEDIEFAQLLLPMYLVRDPSSLDLHISAQTPAYLSPDLPVRSGEPPTIVGHYTQVTDLTPPEMIDLFLAEASTRYADSTTGV